MRYRLNIIFGLVLSFVLTMSTMCIAVVLQGPGGPGGGPVPICILEGDATECEAVVLPDSTTCCECNTPGHSQECPPIDPPSEPDPPTIPDPDSPDPCWPEGGDCDKSAEDTQSVGGKSVECTSSEIRQAFSIPPASDFSTRTAPNSCSSCGDIAQQDIRSIELIRRIVPANQVEFFSFGRGMASEYDMRLTLYPSSTGDHVALLYDPRLETTFYLENLVLADDIYYKSITLTDSNGVAVTDPSLAATQTVYATITRRNGWVYKLEVCATPLSGGEYISRPVEITGPNENRDKITFTYQTHTPAEIASSPTRQLMLSTMTDQYNNIGQYSYHSTQMGSQWVVSQVNVNNGEVVLGYEYEPLSGNLKDVSRGAETTSTYVYAIDAVYNKASLAMNERLRTGHGKNDTLLLSLDYQNGDGQVVNQFMNILQGRRNGAGQVKSLIYQDPANAGWYKVLYEGRMIEYKAGESIRWYTSFTDAGTGYNGIAGILEATYAHSPGMTASLIMNAQPPTSVDETGRTVTNIYDNNGNVERISYSDLTFDRYEYDSNNLPKYTRDREGFVTVIERASNSNIIRVIHGMTDLAGTGSVVSSPEAVQNIFGYYSVGHTNEGLVKWSATEG